MICEGHARAFAMAPGENWNKFNFVGTRFSANDGAILCADTCYVQFGKVTC